jgi:hypothetical protein
MDHKALIDAYKEAEKALLEAERTDLIYGIREGAKPIAPWPTDPCKLVFLDFDGVLNSDISVARLGTRYRFWPPAIEALNGILRQSGAYIVITSTWREHFSMRENAVALERDGLVKGRVVGKTAASSGPRGLEIDSWLRSVPYPVAAFVILDDRNDMAMHLPRLVQTDPGIGLGPAEANRAIAMLQSSNAGLPVQ